MRNVGTFWLVDLLIFVSVMKLFKVFLFILLGGDYGLELAKHSPHKHMALIVGLNKLNHVPVSK